MKLKYTMKDKRVRSTLMILALASLGGFAFPEQLEFFQNGSCVGGFPVLTGGNYSIVDGHRLKLDTKLGVQIYDYEITATSLTLRSEAPCKYQCARTIGFLREKNF